MTRLGGWPVAVTCLGLGLVLGLGSHQQTVGQPPAPPAELPPLSRGSGSFSPVVKRVLPAVVSIEGRARGAAQAEPKQDGTDPGFGSGVIIDPSGVVLTNNHLVADAESVEVTLQDGRKFVSRDIRHDTKSDLAVIKLDSAEALPFLPFADSDAMEVGDRVLAFGAPFGLTGSVTHGIVSAKGRGNLRLNLYEDWLQTDAALNPGSSGGPLVNLEGKVIGITAAIKTRTGGFSGVGLAVASNLCKSVSTQLLKAGVVHRGYLGANLRDLNEDLARTLGVRPNSGAVVVKLYANSPAVKAGLAIGDVVTAVAGRAVRDSRAVQRAISALPLGQPTEVAIVRGGVPMRARVVIEEQPASFGIPAGTATPAPAAPAPAAPPPAAGGAPVALQALGLAVSDLSPELAARLGFRANTTGAVVVAVTADGIAEKAGLRSGTVVVKVDRTAITSAATFRKALGQVNPEKGALLQVMRPNGDLDFVLLRVK